VVKQEQRGGSTQPTAVKGTLTHDGKPGSEFPEVRTSRVDINGIPTWPANGKPITEVDIDADLAESSKPWRLPGTDQTDFFNYGFDEYTWAQYCIRQQSMSDGIADQKAKDAELKAMFGGGAGGGGAGMPPGMPAMPGMPGMPSPEEMMQQMMAQGLNPADPNAFMQMMSKSQYNTN
jgi:pre-mRNA 3'-end-processing factor FIP1